MKFLYQLESYDYKNIIEYLDMMEEEKELKKMQALARLIKIILTTSVLTTPLSPPITVYKIAIKKNPKKRISELNPME